MSNTMTLYCAGCRADTEFERPPCADGHGDCPDLVCTVCGLAMFAFVADELAIQGARDIAKRAGRRGAAQGGNRRQTGVSHVAGAA